MSFKYEIYIPDRYCYGNGVKKIDNLDSIISNCVDKIMSSGIGGVSIRDEVGYYRTSTGKINKMKNKILYFFSPSNYDVFVNNLCLALKDTLRQESILLVRNGEAILC